MSYASYKFHKAIRSLALSSGHKREWLASDCVSRILMLNPEDLPDALHADFQQFREDMTLVPASNNENAHRTTVEAMSDAQVIKMILRILALHEVIKCHGQPFDARYNFPVNRDIQTQAA